MSEQTVENLLGSIPTGEEIKDRREGTHVGKLTMPELVDFGSGKAIKVVFTGMTDADGRSFDKEVRIGLPTSKSESWQHERFLKVAQALGIVPRNQRNAINVDSDNDEQTVLAAFKQIEGRDYSVVVYPNKKSGYLELRVNGPAD
jgi:hypothetical protein